MKNINYHLHLKGYVGGCDFDRNYVDYILAKNEGKPVNVLIDSLGGSLATALKLSTLSTITLEPKSPIPIAGSRTTTAPKQQPG